MDLEHLLDEPKEIKGDSLEHLKYLLKAHLSIEEQIEKTTEQLQILQKELEVISRQAIPTLLNGVNLSELRMESGEKVIIQEKVKASITKKNLYEAFAEMVTAEGGDKEAEEKINTLFKTKVVLPETDDALLQHFIEIGQPYDVQKTIHPQTLNKYCKERLHEGKEIPEHISVFQYQETKIKK